MYGTSWRNFGSSQSIITYELTALTCKIGYFIFFFFYATQRTVTKLTKSYETNSTTVSGIFWWFQLFVGVINVICLACISPAAADAKATFPANSIYPCLDEQLLAGYNHLSSWGFAKCCWIFSSPKTYFSIVRLSGYQNRFVAP